MLQWLHDIKRRVADDFASFVITPKVAIVLTGDVLPCSSRDKLVTTLKDADVFVATYTDHSKYVSSLGARRWVHLMDREKIRYPAGLAKEDMQIDMFQWMHLNFIIAEHADILHSYDLVLKVRFDVLHQDDFMTQIKRLALNAKKPNALFMNSDLAFGANGPTFVRVLRTFYDAGIHASFVQREATDDSFATNWESESAFKKFVKSHHGIKSQSLPIPTSIDHGSEPKFRYSGTKRVQETQLRVRRKGG